MTHSECGLEKHIDERDQRSPGFRELVEQKIDRIDRLEELREESEHWPAVEDMVDCLQDRIHPSSGKLISAKPIHLATYLERFIRPHND
jgi:hypothetical protein